VFQVPEKKKGFGTKGGQKTSRGVADYLRNLDRKKKNMETSSYNRGGFIKMSKLEEGISRRGTGG